MDTTLLKPATEAAAMLADQAKQLLGPDKILEQ
jgi:hypothetical protein